MQFLKYFQKFPKKIKFILNSKKIIKDDLAEKFGSDYKSIYYVDNQKEGVLENKADRLEKKMLTISSHRSKKIQKTTNKIASREYEYNFAEPKEKKWLLRFLKRSYLYLSFMIVVCIGLILAASLKLIPYYPFTISYIVTLLFFILIIYLERWKKRKPSFRKRLPNKLTYKKLIDIYYGVGAFALLIISEFLVYYLYLDRLPDIIRNIYGAFIFVFLITIIIFERMKRVKLSKLCVEVKGIHFGPKMIEYHEGDEFKQNLEDGEEVIEEKEEAATEVENS